MKSKIQLSISITLFLFISASAQPNLDTSKRVSASLDSFIFKIMVDYVSADTLNLNVAEFERNSISHLGEQPQHVVPILANPGVYEHDNSSYDKFLPSVYHKEATRGSPFLLNMYVPGKRISR